MQWSAKLRLRVHSGRMVSYRQEKRYVEGDLTGNSHSAYARLLDDNPDLEAVFCVNDETATGFYEELRRGAYAGKGYLGFRV